MKSKIEKLVVALLAVLFIAGCQSSNTDQEYDTGAGDIFVGDDSIGAINIRVVDDSIGVSETTGFLVQLLDGVGQGVPGVRITCDTEADLALIEPTSGVFITGSTGEASGVLGCEDRGSFMLACRMPSGGKRKIVRVKCEGERPIGFTGFDGAGGGGLGNGVADIGNEEEDTNFSIRITGINFSTVTGDDATSIDTLQGPALCPGADGAPGGGDDIPEPFDDDIVEFTVENNSEQLVRFETLEYSISGVSTPNEDDLSDPISLIGEVVDGGATNKFDTLYLNNISGVKNLHSGIPITVEGFRQVTFILKGVSAGDTPVTATASTTLNFSNSDNCN